MEELHLKETQSGGDEASGAIWGISFESIWIVVVGSTVSVLLGAVVYANGHITVVATAIVALPTVLTVALALFRQANPPGYDTDLLDLWCNGPGFGPPPPPEIP